MVVRCFSFFCVLLMLSGCGLRDRFFGSGPMQADVSLPFDARLNKGTDRRNFTVTVRAGGASIDRVRETVRFEATGYCLNSFGGSDTRWDIDPVTNDWAFRRAGENMIFSGRCTAR